MSDENKKNNDEFHNLWLEKFKYLNQGLEKEETQKKIKKVDKELKELNFKRFEILNEKTSLNLKVNKHEITSTFSKFNETNRYLNLKAILFSSKLKNMTKNEEKIEAFSLDDIFEEKNIQHIDLIKIDTEGHEYEVLVGLSNNIKKVDCVLVEFHNDTIYENYSSEKIHNFLIENNFILLKRFYFPFTTWEDRLYKNSKL